MTKHALTLGCTTDIDGVHLYCTCGWEINLGWDVPVIDATYRAERHRYFPDEITGGDSGS